MDFNGKNTKLSKSSVHKRKLSSKTHLQNIDSYEIVLLANPKSGSCLAEKFLSEFPKENRRIISVHNQVLPCTMRAFDITDKEDKDRS